MRVALVSPYDIDVPGGVQSHVLHLADALEEAGEEVAVVAPGTRSRGRIHAVAGPMSVRFNDSVAPIALAPTAFRSTLRTLKDLRPDVVHVHEPAVPWVSLAAAMRAPAPVVATFHAWSDRDRAYRVARPALRRALSGIAAHVAVSPAAAAYHARALGIAEGAFELVPNGVDVARFRWALPFPQIEGQERLLFVGRLEPRKGLEQLLQAYTIVKANRPELRLYVVGDGPDRERCQALLPARLRADVVFLGRVSDADLPRFYASCDIFVAPALGGESFGIVLIEAMAAGCPIIASDIPGFASVATDGLDARLVPPGDPRALAVAINALLESRTLANALSEQARQTVRQYDRATVADRARRVYTRVLGG